MDSRLPIDEAALWWSARSFCEPLAGSHMYSSEWVSVPVRT